MTNEKRDDWVVSLSLMECVLFLLLLMLFVGGLGLGAGYYMGSQPGHNQMNSVLELAQELTSAHQNERTAVKANYDMVLHRLEKYETFLTGKGIEGPVFPLTQQASADTAVGGGP